jgi:hypothetical protein
MKQCLVNEPTDWHRYLHYSGIDPTCLLVETNQPRGTGIKEKGATESEVASRGLLMVQRRWDLCGYLPDVIEKYKIIRVNFLQIQEVFLYHRNQKFTDTPAMM